MIRAIRTVLGLIVFAALVAAAVYFADRPGQVDIVWQGWQVGTSVGVLVAAAVLGRAWYHALLLARVGDARACREP